MLAARFRTHLRAVVLIPLILGIVLLALVELDLRQYRSGGVTVHSLLMREIPVVVLGLVSSLMNLLGSLVLLIRGQWRLAALALFSATMFVISFQLGGALGAAYLNAT